MPLRPVRRLKYVSPADLKLNPENARKHTPQQLRAIGNAVKEFGFNNPAVVDQDDNVLVGNGRVQAARTVGIKKIPVVLVDDLTPEEAKAYAIADNRLSELSTWDDAKLNAQLKELFELNLEFDIEVTGFEIPEIECRIEGLNENSAESDPADDFVVATGPATTRLGDIWKLGDHRVLCGDARDAKTYRTLMLGGSAAVTITDPPYNVHINGHVGGRGRVKHREFQMASGEMSSAEFIRFLTVCFELIASSMAPGALLYAFMDWRHIGEILAAGRDNDFQLLNLCVWAKTNGGMGSLYRSAHELIFLFGIDRDRHRNNVQLGRFGRNRTNVWTYPGANVRAGKDADDPHALHPTVKPLNLIADAIRDCTARGDIVLDPFLGSGTAVLAAERTNRRCYGIEIDPLYVDTAIARWEALTGRSATHAESGKTFASTSKARRRDAKR